MALDDFIHPWIGSALRHVSAHREVDPLDFSWAGKSLLNRWNDPNQPTLYLAGDEGVLITEWGRHFETQAPKNAERRMVQRTIFRYHLSIDCIVDLRNERVWNELSLPDAPNCFLDDAISRVTARFVRASSRAQGILVPPVGLLDQPDRWNLVLFLEKLPEPSGYVSSVSDFGPLTRG